MAALRLKIAKFNGEYDPYIEKPYLDDFTYYYDEMQTKKDPVKKINKNEE